MGKSVKPSVVTVHGSKRAFGMEGLGHIFLIGRLHGSLVAAIHILPHLFVVVLVTGSQG